MDKIFIDVGFEWRLPGCLMCLGMNNDKLYNGERCVLLLVIETLKDVRVGGTFS